MLVVAKQHLEDDVFLRGKEFRVRGVFHGRDSWECLENLEYSASAIETSSVASSGVQSIL
jgi:hypothetical protein